MEQAHPHMDDEDLRMLRVEQVAELLSVSRNTIYRMVKAGRFPEPIKLGGNTLFSNMEIRLWLDGKLDARKAKAARKSRREIEDLA